MDMEHDSAIMPGFRFHPTDEELVSFYLFKKAHCQAVAAELISELDIYKYDPWDLSKMATVGDKEWYFFSPRDKKYRNSSRPNRVTKAGFWKATGTDRPVHSLQAGSTKCIGLKKSLVFYKGNSARGVKTDWMMHEFRLQNTGEYIGQELALCKIFKKNRSTSEISGQAKNPTVNHEKDVAVHMAQSSAESDRPIFGTAMQEFAYASLNHTLLG